MFNTLYCPHHTLKMRLGYCWHICQLEKLQVDELYFPFPFLIPGNQSHEPEASLSVADGIFEVNLGI